MRPLTKLRSLLVLLLALVSFPVLALAQDPAGAGEKLSPGWQIAFQLFNLVVAPLLAIAIPALGLLIASWLKAKTKNEAIGGAVARMTESIFAAVKLVNQTLRAAVEKAKSPDSDGGVEITKAEAESFKTAAWDALKKEYGGMAGIGKALAALGLSGEGIESWINTRIEAAVHDTNLARESASAPLR